MAADIGHISQLLDATLDPSQHRKGTLHAPLPTLPRCPATFVANENKPPAETALKQEATKPQYSLSLLNIVNSESLPTKTRLAAALAFKNFIRTNYVVRTASSSFPPDFPILTKPALF
jgi:exportin-2 (importin alpha re-exporter)